MTTFVIQPAAAANSDTDINELSPNTNYKTANYLECANFTGLRRNILFRFDLTPLIGYIISTATLYFYGTNSGTSGYIGLYPILAANAGWTIDATWNFADGSSLRWAGDTAGNGGTDAGCSVAGTDYNVAGLGSTYYDTTPDGQENSIVLDLTGFNALIAANYGMILKPTATSFGSQIWSANYGTTAYRPKLVVEGNLPLGHIYLHGVAQAVEPAVTGHVYLYEVVEV
jgi:hypothetical protein